jgi:hypothetical protein
LDSTGSGQGPVAGCCECDDEPSGSCSTELVRYIYYSAGRAMAQAVSHHPLTAEARIRARAVYVRFMVAKVTLG